MRAVLAASLVGLVSAANGDGGIFTSSYCYDSTTYANVLCNATNAVDITNDNGTTVSQCSWIGDVDMTGLGLAINVGTPVTSYGPTVAADAECCTALIDATMMAYYGHFGAFSANTACKSAECAGSSDSGNYTSFYVKGATGLAQNSKHGILPSEAQMAKNWKKLFANQASCLKAGSTYMGANPTKGSMNALSKALLVDQLFAYQGIVTSSYCYSSVNYAGVTCNASDSTHIDITDDNGTSTHQCSWMGATDMTGLGLAINVGTPVTSYGPAVVAMPGCCKAMIDATMMAYYGHFGAFSANTDCMTTTCAASTDSGNYTAKYVKGASGLAQNSKAGVLPSEAQMATNWDVIMANNAACLNTASAYMGANPTKASMNSLSKALLVDQLFAHTSTTTTTTTAAATTTAAQSSATTAASSSATTVAATTTAAPTTAVVVKATYDAPETLPTGTTGAQLMSSAAYVAAKKAGLESALSATVVITGFTIASRRQLSGNSTNSTGTQVTVTTAFTVNVASDSAADTMVTAISNAGAAIKTATETAMAAQNWSTDGGVMSAAPTLGSITVATPTKETVTVMASGTWTRQLYSDATCATKLTTQYNSASGAIGSCVDTTDANGAGGATASSCGSQLVLAVTSAADCSGTASAATMDVGVCQADGSNFVMVTCAATVAGGASTASATGAVVSAAAVVAGALML